MKVSRRVCLLTGVLFVTTALLIPTGEFWAYPQYSVARDATNCRACHGDFRASPYSERAPGGGIWPDGLMDTHEGNIVPGDCGFCHSSGPRFPVLTNSSTGVTGFAGLSCVGCHGRLEDATSGTDGAGAGLRQHHWRAGVETCIDCHADADPNAKSTADESTSPPHFRDPAAASHPNIPTNACNPRPTFTEDIAGSTKGLDNDGDGIYDENDSDCATGSLTPGEASMLLVTAHNAATSVLSINYDNTTCLTIDNNIEFGSLAAVNTYAYSGQECSIGNTGVYSWNYPPGSLFFVVVANDGIVEGSYGIDGNGEERPEDAVSILCPLPQALADDCE